MDGSLRSRSCANILQLSEESDEVYIFDIKEPCDKSCVFASASDCSVSVLDRSNIERVRSIKAHKERVNCIEPSNLNPFILCSASSDKSVRVWDLRTTCDRPTIQIKMSDEVLATSLGANDTLLAVPTALSLKFFDIRCLSGVVLHTLEDLHSETITACKFLPDSPSTVATAAEDGLICIHNLLLGQEEEVTVGVINTDCSVRSFGFFGDSHEGLFAISTVETVSCWHHESAIRLGNYTNLREEYDINYLVDCAFDSSSDQLSVLAGCFEGQAKVIPLLPNSDFMDESLEACAEMEGMSTAELLAANRGRVTELDKGGHTGVVRCLLPLQWTPQRKVFITGGEDSRICKWDI